VKVRYLANDVVTDLPDDAAAPLIAAGICVAIDETTESTPTVKPKRAR
jgi:hypothetical protein